MEGRVIATGSREQTRGCNTERAYHVYRNFNANAEGGPGSPAVDKPAASPFGPVTYKPRIPNIFARRQQQQQQQSQSNSPRASTDVPTLATPVEAQRSVDTTPRTSLQQPSAPLSQALAPEGEKVEERQN